MENFIELLETYWGFTIFGGITVGILATFVGVQIKTLLRDRLKNKVIYQLIETNNELVESNKVLVSKYEDLDMHYEKQVAQNVLSEQIQATTFKSISYLVMSSKLPNEEKLVLKEDFDRLKEATRSLASLAASERIAKEKHNVENKVEKLEEVTQSVAESVGEAIAVAGSLLTKYTRV